MSGSEPTTNNVFKLYPSRWFQLFLFSMLSFTNASFWIFAAPISDTMQHVFDVSSFSISTLSLVYMIVYVPGVFPAAFLMDKYGLKVSLWLGGGITFVSGWIRYVGGLLTNFPILLLGQVAAAVAQLFILSVPAVLGSTWFGANERSLAVSIAVIANQLGIAFGFVLPALMTGLSHNSKTGVNYLLIFQAIQGTICGIGVFLWVAKRPPTPPSFSSSVARLSFRQSFSKMMRNFSLVMLFLGFSFQIGAFWAFSTVLSSILSPYGFSDSAVGWIGFMNIITGVVGSFLAGYALDKTGAFRQLTIITFFGTTISLLWFILRLHSAIEVYISYGLFGFFLTASIPTSLQLTVEYSYPVSEDTSSALFFAGSCFSGILLIIFMTLLDKGGHTTNSYTNSNYLAFGVTALGLLLTLFLRGDYARRNADFQSLLPPPDYIYDTTTGTAIERRSSTATNHGGSEEDDRQNGGKGIESVQKAETETEQLVKVLKAE